MVDTQRTGELKSGGVGFSLMLDATDLAALRKAVGPADTVIELQRQLDNALGVKAELTKEVESLTGEMAKLKQKLADETEAHKVCDAMADQANRDASKEHVRQSKEVAELKEKVNSLQQAKNILDDRCKRLSEQNRRLSTPAPIPFGLLTNRTASCGSTILHRKYEKTLAELKIARADAESSKTAYQELLTKWLAGNK
ncbi:hypothetical protein [Streptomyces rimosus]|uniref:hypothetical protein n=1 Tax=Streptomyces rimosus TaxID=1927 RepID=UPI00131BC241|nr:hypothetical protein [Streptomyces rimosus]